ncbi:MAG: hypothetical protein U5R30_19545 [Deltaproteobacteria bacterium]|nr:hypothetical protein [Deltaproteobacteria bacterium]
MALQYNDLTKTPIQRNLIEVRGDGNVLQQFLGIHPPDDASKSPPILAFKRKREVEIPWGEIFNDEAVISAGTAASAIRKYFEESWDFQVNKDWMKDSAHHLLDSGSGSWWVMQLQNGKPPVYRPDFDKLDPQAQGKPTSVPLTEGFVIRHGTSGRLYLLINPKKTLSVQHFNSFALYESAWQNEIEGVELVFESEADAQSCYMDFEEIDLRPVIIQRKYEELRIARDFAKKVKANVAAVTDKMITQITGTTMDIDEIEQLQRKVLRLEIGEYEAQRRIERLASDAAQLGYLLFIEDKEREITYKDGRKTKLVPGKLYTTYKRTAHWTEKVSVNFPIQVSWWIFRHTEMRQVQIPYAKEEVVEDYQAVDTSKDILAETRSAMIKAGQNVFVFEQTPSGLASTEGDALHLIMDRCKYDETFRRSCVIMLPVYEDSLTGQRLVAKYAIFKRPLPGMVPTILPRLSLEESLTYRTAWVETQLGELLNSINLAPGEERQVTITKRFEQETTVTRTSTSIFDISRSETSDLATEMENQTRREQENSKSMQFSTKASASFGGFSAEASASGGASSSLKDMSQAISKVATKAAKSVSSQNREEVSSTATARTTISNTDETVATIHNINQGRTLNLMFYRLYNKYKGGLFLEGLRFDVIPGVEVIAGSGVHESRSYSLEELPGLIAEFKAAQLPFAIKDEETYTNRLLDSIETLLDREYGIDSEDKNEDRGLTILQNETIGAPAQPRAPATSLSVARLSFPPPEAYQPAMMEAGPTGTGSRMANLSKKLCLTVIHSDEPIAPQDLLIAAPGLYLDATVGALPGTEPYSERMREQEVRMRAAEVAFKESEGAYQRAMALRLTRMQPMDCANCLTDALPGTDQMSLVLSLMMPLLPGDWYLQVDGEEMEKVEKADVGRQIIAFSWSDPQKWLKAGNLRFKIRLVDKNSGDIIPFQGNYHDQS